MCKGFPGWTLKLPIKTGCCWVGSSGQLPTWTPFSGEKLGSPSQRCKAQDPSLGLDTSTSNSPQPHRTSPPTKKENNSTGTRCQAWILSSQGYNQVPGVSAQLTNLANRTRKSAKGLIGAWHALGIRHPEQLELLGCRIYGWTKSIAHHLEAMIETMVENGFRNHPQFLS